MVDMSLPLARVLELLETLAPLRFAESWDNVGLLLEPHSKQDVGRVLLTIDLTSAVLDEAGQRGAELVVAYHPPLFKALKRIRQGKTAESVVAGALGRGIAVYSPHTALDAAPDGVNDWLAGAVGPGLLYPLVPSSPIASGEHKLVVFVPAEHAARLREALVGAGAGVIGDYTHCSFNLTGTGTFLGGEGSKPSIGRAGQLESVEEIRLEMLCPAARLSAAARAIAEVHPYEEPAWEIYPLAPKPELGFGMGRGVELDTPAPLDELVRRVKTELGLSWVRLAAAERHHRGEPVRRIAVCAGSGGELFERAPGFDLYLTGELRHHDLLALNAAGSSAILCDHSNTERGYLPHYARRISDASGHGLEVLLAEADREPLVVV
jgi:dinuclear metal center YbgI/SA1388 family protein